MNEPWLSVIIPTYNGEAFLPFALDSIVAQQDPAIECIAVDDGSTDATLRILATYHDRLTLRVLRRSRQENWAANTNYALSFAEGSYVSFLHQDDLWLDNRLGTIRRLVERFPSIGFFLHSSRFVDTEGRNLGMWRCPLPSLPRIIESRLIVERLLIQNFISIPAPLFRRDIVLKVGGLDEALWYTSDWDLWLKIAAQSDTLYCPTPLSAFRVHTNSQTVVRSSFRDDFREQLEKVANKHLMLWDAAESAKRKTKKIVDFSIEVNTALAGTFHGAGNNLPALLASFLLLGPSGSYRYLRDSRIWERVSARLKAQLAARRG